MTVVWIVVLVVSVLLYGILMACILPRYFLKTEFIPTESKDRGIKNIKETTGRSIVYQPALEYRKYVPQYLISERKGKKILLCKLASNIKYIDYDVVMFDGQNKICKVVHIKELIEKEGYTEKVELGAEVAYISLIVNTVNDTELPKKTLRPITSKKVTLYMFTSVCITAIEVFLIRLCCSCLFGGVFQESFMLFEKSILITEVAALAAVVIILGFILNAILKGNREKTDKGER